MKSAIERETPTYVFLYTAVPLSAELTNWRDSPFKEGKKQEKKENKSRGKGRRR